MGLDGRQYTSARTNQQQAGEGGGEPIRPTTTEHHTHTDGSAVMTNRGQWNNK